MVNGKKFGLVGLIAAGIMAVSGNSIKAEPIGTGKLRITNYVYHNDFIRKAHNTLHYSGCTEGYDEGWDCRYYPKYNLETKIISRIPDYEYELDVESRHVESLTPVDLELSLYSISGSVSMDNENELWISLPFSSDGWDFGKKPITLWEKTIIDPNNNPNEPNNYTISFIADIREAIDRSDFYTTTGKTAKIPIQKLQGTFYNNNPYMYAQTNFKIFPGDFNLDGKVNIEDYAVLANDFNRTDANDLISNISGPLGIPDYVDSNDPNIDGKAIVDFYDLSLFTRDYLKDSNDQSTWRDFPYEY